MDEYLYAVKHMSPSVCLDPQTREGQRVDGPSLSGAFILSTENTGSGHPNTQDFTR